MDAEAECGCIKTKRRGDEPRRFVFEKERRGLALHDGRLAALLDCGGNGRGGDVAGIAGEGLRLLGEELDEMGDVGVSAGLELFLDVFHDGAELGAALGIEFGDVVRVFRNDVVGSGVAIEGDLVEAGAVVEIAEADEADFLEGGEAAVNGDEVAGGVGEIVMDLLDAGRGGAFQKCFENRDSRLSDTKPGGFESGAGHVDGRWRLGG